MSAVWKMNNTYESFPMIEDIFNKLSQGCYISQFNLDTTRMYEAIQLNQDNFERYFQDIGYTLVRHPKHAFYYLDKDGRSGETVKKCAVMISLLMQDDPQFEFNVLKKEYLTSALPYQKSTHLKNLAESAGLSGDLKKLLTQMNTIGLIKFIDKSNDIFVFQVPVFRFIDGFRMINKQYEELNVVQEEGEDNE